MIHSAVVIRLRTQLSDRQFHLLLMSFAIVLMVWRMPDLFVHPRFWAEEGTVQFAKAYHDGPWLALTYNIGYFSIIPNIATGLAAQVKIEYAPFVTLAISFLIQLATCSVIILGNSAYWQTRSQKILLISGIILLSPAEIWLNTICAQYWFCLCAILILCEDSTHNLRQTNLYFRILLIIAGINGILSCVLTPVYLLRYIRFKTRENFIHASILVATSLLQAGLLLFTIISRSNSGAKSHLVERFNFQEISVLKNLFMQFIWPYTGYLRKEDLLLIMKSPLSSAFSMVYLTSAIFVIIAICVVIYSMIQQKTIKNYESLFVSFALLFVFSNLFAVHLAYSQRYAFVPSIILLIIMLEQSYIVTINFTRVLAILFVVIAFVSNTKQLETLDFMSTIAPNWQKEIQFWRLDCSYKPKVWPYRPDWEWEVDLSCGESAQRAALGANQN